MATFNAARAVSSFPVPSISHNNGVQGVSFGVYNIATNPTAADIINMCKVPAGATVIAGFIQAVDLDTNATETIDFDAGWADNGTDVADPDGFGNFGVQTGDASVHLPVAGIWMPFANIIQSAGFKTFAAETTLTITNVATAATGGTGIIKMVVWFVGGGIAVA